jgi:hypothetical protein
MQEPFGPGVGDPAQISPQGGDSQDKQSGLGGRQCPTGQHAVDAREDLVMHTVHTLHTF